MLELKAKTGCCEEAHVSSGAFYIPCNEPAVSVVKTRDEKPYRMCAACTNHNVKNRGAKLIGTYDGPPAEAEEKAAPQPEFTQLEPVLEPTADGLAVLYSDEKAAEFFLARLKEAGRPAREASVSNKDGRDLIRSTAAKMSSVKARIEEKGKALTEPMRLETKRVNAIRDTIVAAIQVEQKEVRLPLTEWEEADKQREAMVSTVIDRIKTLSALKVDDTSDAVRTRLDRLTTMTIDASMFLEREQEAQVLIETGTTELRGALDRLTTQEAQAKRLADLERAEKQREREAAAAIAEANRVEAQRIENERLEAARAEAEAAALVRAEEAKAQALAAQEAAHKAQVEAMEAQRVADLQAMERRQREEEEARVRREEELRAAEERRQEQMIAADLARKRDYEHRQTVMVAAIESLIEYLGPTVAELAPTIIQAIADGKVTNATINF